MLACGALDCFPQCLSGEDEVPCIWLYEWALGGLLRLLEVLLCRFLQCLVYVLGLFCAVALLEVV